MSEIRTRFAPSPTGYMHVGNLRTALYEYLCAKKDNGKFILRIEDTDQERFVEGSIDIIYQTMQEAGLIHDEGPDKDCGHGPYVQSKRLPIYQEMAYKLVKEGKAYYCFCDKERLENLRASQEAAKIAPKYDGHCKFLSVDEIEASLKAGKSYVIRQIIPTTGTTTFSDVVYGEITVENSTLDDQILLKSDGYPTYNFANVVDDHLMNITHVIRGSEYLSSTPKYNLLYQAFGWEIPVYVHCPPVMKDSQNKLSKRNGDASYQDLVAKGYLTEAIINYIALLGWHPASDRELFTLEELKQEFDISRISKSPAIFDKDKLNWMNSHYIKQLTSEDLAKRAESFFNNAKLDISDKDRYLKIIDVCRGGICYIEQLVEKTRIFFTSEFKAENAEAQEMLDNPVSKSVFAWLAEKAVTVENLTGTAFKELVNQAGKELSVKGKNLWMPVRVALTGQNHGPEMDQIVDLFGKDKVVERMQNAAR